MMSSAEYSSLDSKIKQFGGSHQPKVLIPDDKYTPERCEFCGNLFRNVSELIEHSATHF